MGFTAQVVHAKEIPEVVYRCVRNFHCSTTQEEVRPRFVLTSDGCCVTPFLFSFICGRDINKWACHLEFL